MPENLTKKQQAKIDALLLEYPHITAESVNAFYVHCYAMGYKIYIQTGEGYHDFEIITHTDHKHTAKAKVMHIRDYVTKAIERRGNEQTAAQASHAGGTQPD